jgi:hypothetical protein
VKYGVHGLYAAPSWCNHTHVVDSLAFKAISIFKDTNDDVGILRLLRGMVRVPDVF